MRLGDPGVRDGWVKGRTVVMAGASVITMGPDGDFVGDIVIRDDRIVALGSGRARRRPAGRRVARHGGSQGWVTATFMPRRARYEALPGQRVLRRRSPRADRDVG